MKLPDDLLCRPATAEDAAAAAALGRACDETYVEWAPAGWRPPELGSGWAARLNAPGRWSRVLVDPGGRLVALVSFRPAFEAEAPGAPAGEPVPGMAHLGTLLVDPSRWRQGIASALLARAEAAMVEAGYVRARLWTPLGAPAEAFYRARGWSLDGRSAFHEWLGLPVVGYARVL